MKKLTKKETNNLVRLLESALETKSTLNYWFSHLSEEQRTEKRLVLDAEIWEIKKKLGWN